MLVALGIDALIGWPDALFRRIGHPVTWIGALIQWLEDRLHRTDAERARRAGTLTVAASLGVTLALALLIALLLPSGPVGAILAGLCAWPLVAARSLDAHVSAVARPLAAGDTAGARQAVSMIVGRDPARLDRSGIARAALESLAENASDGVVAPLFWGVIAGLPGIALYKTINTLDSMIGHRTVRHLHFGRAAARLDDAVNWAPARLTAGLLALTAPRPYRAAAVALRDARAHRSPNAGWPEAAMAGGLGVRLSGPRIYADTIADEPWLNAGAPDPEPPDLARGLSHYRRAMALMAALLAALAFV
ncbi:MAG: adenosylcobinamide-phosphate synthase CbiB [Pseudomonadota bacterium]